MSDTDCPEPFCPEHVNYKAHVKPQDCPWCWAVYLAKNPDYSLTPGEMQYIVRQMLAHMASTVASLSLMSKEFCAVVEEFRTSDKEAETLRPPEPPPPRDV
jgi:hypothetical protein